MWDNFYTAGRKRDWMWIKLENTHQAESNVERAEEKRRLNSLRI